MIDLEQTTNELLCSMQTKWQGLVYSVRWLLDILLIAAMCANTFFVLNLMHQIRISEIFRVRPADVLEKVEILQQDQKRSMEQFESVEAILIDNAEQLRSLKVEQ